MIAQKGARNTPWSLVGPRPYQWYAIFYRGMTTFFGPYGTFLRVLVPDMGAEPAAGSSRLYVRFLGCLCLTCAKSLQQAAAGCMYVS